MGLVQEFRSFALRGNVVDMAVGILVGGAFGKISTSFVNDVLMPPIGILVGETDFSRFQWTLREATANSPAVTLNYGAFVTTMVDFLIIAVAAFLVVKGMNALQRQEQEAPPAPELTREQMLLSEIRDALRAR